MANPYELKLLKDLNDFSPGATLTPSGRTVGQIRGAVNNGRGLMSTEFVPTQVRQSLGQRLGEGVSEPFGGIKADVQRMGADARYYGSQLANSPVGRAGASVMGNVALPAAMLYGANQVGKGLAGMVDRGVSTATGGLGLKDRIQGVADKATGYVPPSTEGRGLNGLAGAQSPWTAGAGPLSTEAAPKAPLLQQQSDLSKALQEVTQETLGSGSLPAPAGSLGAPKDPETGLNSFAVGTPLVEEDQYAKIHAGEAIIPAEQNPYNPENALPFSAAPNPQAGPTVTNAGGLPPAPVLGGDPRNPVVLDPGAPANDYGNGVPQVGGAAGAAFNTFMARGLQGTAKAVGDVVNSDFVQQSGAGAALRDVRGLSDYSLGLEGSGINKHLGFVPATPAQGQPAATAPAQGQPAATAPAQGQPAAKGLPDFAKIPNAAAEALKDPKFPGSGRPKNPAAPAALPASQRLGEITKVDPNSAKPEDLRWSTVMADRVKELETFGVDTTKMTGERQINQAWRERNEAISKVGLDARGLLNAVEAKVNEYAAAKGIDPKDTPPAIRDRAYKLVTADAVEKKATDFYSKYSWFKLTPPEEGKYTPPKTRREKEWALFNEVKTNPRLNALDHIKPDGSLDYDSATKALKADKEKVANDALNRDIKKDAANTARDVAGTEYTKALTASLKDPKSLTPAQKEALRSHADAAAEESALIRSKADKYREDFGELSDAEWDTYVSEGDKTVAAILRNPALYDKFRADKTVHPLARTYINRELAVAKGTGLK